MSHSFDIECIECYQKFCQCHDAIYVVSEDGDHDCIFCSQSCKEEYEEGLNIVLRTEREWEDYLLKKQEQER